MLELSPYLQKMQNTYLFYSTCTIQPVSINKGILKRNQTLFWNIDILIIAVLFEKHF